MSDVFLHNPHCSKSRAALDIVRDAGVELPVREYLSEPLSVEELRRIVDLLGVRPIAIVRRGEPQYAALGLTDATPDDEVLRAMAEYPILIERPIVVRGGRAVIGRPPETVREILQLRPLKRCCRVLRTTRHARLESSAYELILLDLMMPHVDGHAVLRFLSRMPAPRPIVIVMSARVSLSEDETNVVTAVAKKPAGIVVILEILPDLCRTLKESPMSPATPGDQREDIRRG